MVLPSPSYIVVGFTAISLFLLYMNFLSFCPPAFFIVVSGLDPECKIVYRKKDAR